MTRLGGLRLGGEGHQTEKMVDKTRPVLNKGCTLLMNSDLRQAPLLEAGHQYTHHFIFMFMATEILGF